MFVLPASGATIRVPALGCRLPALNRQRYVSRVLLDTHVLLCPRPGLESDKLSTTARDLIVDRETQPVVTDAGGELGEEFVDGDVQVGGAGEVEGVAWFADLDRPSRIGIGAGGVFDQVGFEVNDEVVAEAGHC